MRRFESQLLLVFIVCTTIACEKVIDIDLDSVEQKTVIEAQLIEHRQEISVQISKTSDYFDPSPPEFITGAQLMLSDNLGASWVLNDNGDGSYHAPIQATTGAEYTLSVDIDGVLYEAKSVLLPKVELEEVYTEYQEEAGFIDEGYSAYLRFNDPPEVDNYYRITYAVNGELRNEGEDLQVTNDNLYNGILTRVQLFDIVFELNDTIDFSLIHFDKPSYDYWNELAAIAGEAGGPGGGVAAPGNPTSNWSSGALGYFSCIAVDSMRIVVTD